MTSKMTTAQERTAIVATMAILKQMDNGKGFWAVEGDGQIARTEFCEYGRQAFRASNRVQPSPKEGFFSLLNLMRNGWGRWY